MNTKFKNLTGKRFSKLLILDRIGSDHYGVIWKCKCDCGNETKAYTSKILNGRKKSCGCLKIRENHYMWSGYKEITGFTWSQIKKGAFERGIDFNLNIEEVWQLFLKQERKCALTGEDLYFAKNTEEFLNRRQTASLDRINSEKPYEIGNVQWVHKIINIMKGELSDSDFRNWCYKVNKYEKR